MNIGIRSFFTDIKKSQILYDPPYSSHIGFYKRIGTLLVNPAFWFLIIQQLLNFITIFSELLFIKN